MLKTILQNFHLEKLFWIFKTKLKYMILAGLVCGVLAGAFSYFTRTNTYMAQISMYVYTNPDYINDNGINLSASDISNANALLSSYMQIMKSNSFLKSVIEDAELDPTMYSVSILKRNITSSAVGSTAVFRVNVYDENPYNAMLIANTIGKLAPQKIISIVKSGGIEVLDEAVLPTSPYRSSSITLMALVGIVAGGFLSLVFFMARGLLDTRYRRVYEVEDMFTVPILGMVPQINDVDDKGEPKVKLVDDSPFVLKEAYNDIRTNLLFMGKGENCPVFAVTGADYDEGKTTNSINLAISYANMGKKVLLIDADLRNGNIAAEFGLEPRNGLSEYLAGINKKINVRKNIRENLDLITTGVIPPNPTDLLISDTWKEMIQNFKNEYDVIVLDTPSIGVVADGVELVNVATAFIVVVREFVSRFEREELIIRRLEAVNANICGFIYNGIDVHSVDYNHKDYVDGGDYGKHSSTGVQHRKLFKKKS
ncbi:polysaccharide biosynthesis tyrosine autokinase [Butyrivibrio sp. VCB2006]|uniref:polysaccharide biosynthesis tyrosine autokinase n=1 Tax=Butyrivibrio sp. VCB2006 TaxID=1280679 RepID=UPI0003F53EA6|nr:polysaccharide biosynthesis tyrosine autokinase [Butyrivibrio sp. VCB2006]